MIAALNGSYFEYKNKKGNSTLKMTSWERSGFIWEVNPGPTIFADKHAINTSFNHSKFECDKLFNSMEDFD